MYKCCQNCGRREKHPYSQFLIPDGLSWWGGKLVCKECERKLRNNEQCQFCFDVEDIKRRLKNLHSKDTNIDQLAFDVETIYGEHGYRRMSRDADIIEWIKGTRAYNDLTNVDDRIVNCMTGIWMLVLNGVK